MRAKQYYLLKCQHNGHEHESWEEVYEKFRQQGCFDFQAAANNWVNSKLQIKIPRNDLGNTIRVEVLADHVIDGKKSTKSVATVHVTPYLEPMTEDEYESEYSNLLQDIPTEFHDFIRTIAWDRGHSSGYEDVLSAARELANPLKKAISEYTKQVRNGHEVR